MKKFSPLVIGLLASVALNGILIGMLVAGQNPSPPDNRRGNSNGLDIGNLARSLPQDEREAFIATLPDGRNTELSNALRDLNRSQKHLSVLLAADTLDMAAIDVAMADIRSKRLAVSKLGDNAIANYFSALPADRRTEIIETMSQRRRGGGGDGERRENQRGSRDNTNETRQSRDN